MPGFSDAEGHLEPAVSVRHCLKTHGIQTGVLHERNSSLKVCPAVEDEEIVDDKAEQSEESRE